MGITKIQLESDMTFYFVYVSCIVIRLGGSPRKGSGLGGFLQLQPLLLHFLRHTLPKVFIRLCCLRSKVRDKPGALGGYSGEAPTLLTIVVTLLPTKLDTGESVTVYYP